MAHTLTGARRFVKPTPSWLAREEEIGDDRQEDDAHQREAKPDASTTLHIDRSWVRLLSRRGRADDVLAPGRLLEFREPLNLGIVVLN
jgi:hypothetical protein